MTIINCTFIKILVNPNFEILFMVITSKTYSISFTSKLLASNFVCWIIYKEIIFAFIINREVKLDFWLSCKNESLSISLITTNVADRTTLIGTKSTRNFISLRIFFKMLDNHQPWPSIADYIFMKNVETWSKARRFIHKPNLWTCKGIQHHC